MVAELLIIVFGDDPLSVSAPPGLDGSVDVLGDVYPTYRLALIGVGAVLALVVWLVVERTRVGALVRATVADREMVAALGVDNRLVKVGRVRRRARCSPPRPGCSAGRSTAPAPGWTPPSSSSRWSSW